MLDKFTISEKDAEALKKNCPLLGRPYHFDKCKDELELIMPKEYAS